MKKEFLDYGVAMKNLLRQAFSVQRYKELNVGLRVVLYLLTWPALLGMLAGAAMFGLVLIAYKFIKSPIEYLMNFIRSEGEDVKHATQFIIYAIGFPIVMLLQAWVAFISLFLFVIFLMTNISASLWTMGGCEFMPFINDQRERGPRKPWANPNLNGVSNAIVLGVLILIGLIIVIADFAVRRPFMDQTIAIVILFVLWNLGLLFGCIEKKAAKTVTAAPAMKAEPADAGDAVAEQVQRLQELKDNGVITEDEYQEKVRKIL